MNYTIKTLYAVCEPNGDYLRVFSDEEQANQFITNLSIPEEKLGHPHDFTSKDEFSNWLAGF